MKSFALLAGVALAANASPVQKVIQLIEELKGKVQKDLQNEAGQMEEYAQFCDDEQTQKGFAIKTATREIEGFKAAIEHSEGQVQEFGSIIEAAGGESAAKNQELASATDVRNNENSDFKAAQKELVESIDALARAVVIIKREMSFVQAGKKSDISKKLTAMSGALSAIIEASWLDASNRNKLKNFLETEDEFSLKQPQASVKNYENHSGGIVETLEDMKDKAETALNNLRREETKARHAFELIKQSLADAVTNLEKEISEAKSSKSGASEALAKAQGDLSNTEAAKKADQDYVAKLTLECNNKASEWAERQKSAQAEMAALAKGHEILAAKFGFAQVARSTVTVRNSDFGARDRVMGLLKKLGRTYNSFALMQMANAASKDPFVKIRGMIENMIQKLLKQAQEEATQEAFCQEETAKATKSREQKSAASDKYQARIDEAKATGAELKNQIAVLTQQISEIERSNSEATNMRQKEHAEFGVASKDYKESAEAITQALVVLKDFYRGESLLQQPSFGDARGDAGHSIIEILETAQEDFTRLLAEAETSETEAAEAYKSLMQENKVAKSTKNASIKAKTSEAKSIEVALVHHNEDLETVSKELDAVMGYLSKLKPQCESKAMSYEERKARREAEIAGLKEALSVLEGEDIGVFIQQRGFLRRN